VIVSEEKFIASGQLRLWTERSGNPGSPAVLLIMGTSAQGIGWPDELVGTLVAGGRQVIRFDHRDTGRSSCVDFDKQPYALADMAADALAVLDGHDVDAAHIVGASLGGAIAQWIAVHRPERVLTLTAIMTGPLGHNAGPAWARVLTGQEPDPDDLPPPSPRFLRHLAERAAMPTTSRDEQIEAGLETWAKITAPALVIHGTADPLRPLPHGRALAAQIPQARLEAVPGMGHGFFSPGLPRRIGEIILDHTQSGVEGVDHSSGLGRYCLIRGLAVYSGRGSQRNRLIATKPPTTPQIARTSSWWPAKPRSKAKGLSSA
jgi:pimeloyl-ACP methyl ester carboxylesterase